MWKCSTVIGNSPASFGRHATLKVATMFWALGFAVMTAAPARALECPNPQLVGSEGALIETPAIIASRGHTLAARGSAAVPSIIFSLRKKYPHASDAEITNYMITAYCPVLNRKTGLTGAQRKSDLEKFANQVRARLQ
jgi:hypothetical protein